MRARARDASGRQLRDALNAQPDLQSRVFEALERIKPADVLSEGRFYGGGLHKVEPKELGQIPAPLLLESIDSRLFIEQQESLFEWGNKKKGN